MQQQPSDVDHEDAQELRLAVVMTGGVSLAVWMGGVTHEINRLRASDPYVESTAGESDVYRRMLELTGSSVRLDVVSGASAGGLNGALLGTAVAYDADLEGLRDLWLDEGDFQKLLRDPLEPDAPSLLLGDKVFLPAVHKALTDLTAGPHGDRTPTPCTEHPVEIVVTGSLLQGEERGVADDFGSVLRDRDHRAEFRFSRGRSGLSRDDRPDDDDTHDDFALKSKLKRIAEAARASASFPVAFEPRFWKVEREPNGRGQPTSSSFSRSGWVVDGGVLVNKPIAPALRAVAQQSASRQVRRVLLYVVPDPGEEPQSAGKTAERPPSVRRPPSVGQILFDSLSTLPRNESIVDDLNDLEAHNSRARIERRRRDLLATLDLDTTQAGLVRSYWSVLARNRAERLLERVAAAVPRLSRRETPPEISGASLRNAPLLRRALARRLSGSDAAEPPFADPRAGRRAGEDALDLLRRGLGLTPPDAEDVSRKALRAHRTELHQILRKLEVESDRAAPSDEEVEEMAKNAIAVGSDREAEEWAETAAPVLTQAASGGESFAERIASVVVAAAEPLDELCGRPRPGQGREAERVRGLLWRTLLLSPGAPLPPAFFSARPEAERVRAVGRCREGLFALEVLRVTLGSGEEVVGQHIELMQLSADTPNGFTDDTAARNKLAGIQLGHFGAFYKRSWRANDWLWGRLDGAARLAQVLVDPYRLRQRFTSSAPVVERLRKIALGSDPGDQEVLTWPEDEVARELAFLDRPEDEGATEDTREGEGAAEGTRTREDEDESEALPASLPLCSLLVARRLQLEILKRELPFLAGAIRHDERQGSAPGPADGLAEALPENVETPSAGRAVYLFRRQNVGREKIGDEWGTDLFVRTTSRTVGTLGSVLQRASKGFGPLRVAGRLSRGLGLTLYLLVVGAVSGSTAWAAATVGALAAGGALIAVGAYATGLSSLLFLAGVVLLLAGAVLVALRLGWKALFVAPVVLLVFGALAAGPDLLAWWYACPGAAEWRTVGVTLGFVFAGALLGYVGVRLWKMALLIALVVLAVVGALFAVPPLMGWYVASSSCKSPSACSPCSASAPAPAR